MAAGIIEDDGRAELVDAALVFSMVAGIGMVACQYKDGIFEPRFLSGLSEEAAQGIIGIADTFVNGQFFFAIHLFIFVGHVERMMTGQRKQSRHKGLFHIAHLHAEILQERLIPDAPPVVVSCTAFRS